MNALPDGAYDVVIIDAEIIDETTMRVEMLLVAGEEKGNVVALRGPHLASDATTLLGLPATMRVVNGVPRVVLDAV